MILGERILRKQTNDAGHIFREKPFQPLQTMADVWQKMIHSGKRYFIVTSVLHSDVTCLYCIVTHCYTDSSDVGRPLVDTRQEWLNSQQSLGNCLWVEKLKHKFWNFDTINIYNVLHLFFKQVFLFFTIQYPWRKIWMVDFLRHFALLFAWQSRNRAKPASWHQSILILENEK